MKKFLLITLLTLTACETKSCISKGDPTVPVCVGFGLEGGAHVTEPQCADGFVPRCVPTSTVAK